MKNIFIFLLFLLSHFFLIPAQAFSWPTFKPPLLDFLLQNNLIETSSCPPGQGKLKDGLRLNIQQNFCRRWCPTSWEWISVSDYQCHDLGTDFNFQKYAIKFTRNDANNTLFSTVTAFYGKQDNPEPTVNFVFTSEADNHWQCSVMSEEYRTIICANDI